MPITAERCVELLRDALANRPADVWSQEFIDWHADIIGTIRAYNGSAMLFEMHMGQIANVGVGMHSPMSMSRRENAIRQFAAQVRSLYTELRLQTNAFQTAQVGAGAMYDYFSEVRQLMSGATRDLLFIDPYIDASFVERYLPQVPQGATVRLLTAERQATALTPALTLYRQQHGAAVELRVVPDRSIHDRHLIIDGRDVYQSGASFKDGARNAPTSINQIVDVAADLIRAHEATWNGARVVP